MSIKLIPGQDYPLVDGDTLQVRKLQTLTSLRLKGYTVATLPTGVQGDVVFVTDALLPAFLTTVAGGGAVVTPVFFDGSSWITI